MKKFDLSILTVAVILVGLALLGMSQPAKQEPTYAAKVNGVVITDYAFTKALKEVSGGQVLESLIDEELIKQAAQKEKVEATPEELTKEVENIKTQVGAPEEFEKFLKQNFITEETLKEKMKIKVLYQNMVEKRVNVTEEEMKKFFEENKDKLGVDNPKYEDQKDLIKKALINKKKQEESSVLIKELRKNAKIEKANSVTE